VYSFTVQWYTTQYYSIMMMHLGITRFVHGGCQNILQISTNGRAWEMCVQFLQQYCEGEVFLQWIFTGDGT